MDIKDTQRTSKGDPGIVLQAGLDWWRMTWKVEMMILCCLNLVANDGALA
jgi:hypothetical protein